MHELKRRIRGKVRQNRREYHAEINKAVNLTSTLFTQHFEDNNKFLSRVQSDSFKVLIMSTEKDCPLAHANASSLLALYPSQIPSIDIVMPGSHAQNKLDSRITFVDESKYLQNSEVLLTLKGFNDRANWVKQQYIKMKYVSESECPVLIIDADTFLTRPIFLFSDQLHTLLIGNQDFHYPYTAHSRKFLNDTQPLLNFVNHFQIQMPGIYNHIFPDDFDLGWIRWANLGRIYGEDSPVSEFQTYAGAVLKHSKLVPIFASLEHETRDLSHKTIGDLERAIQNYEGHLFTVGGKILLIN